MARAALRSNPAAVDVDMIKRKAERKRARNASIKEKAFEDMSNQEKWKLVKALAVMCDLIEDSDDSDN